MGKKKSYKQSKQQQVSTAPPQQKREHVDYTKIRVGRQELDDALVNLRAAVRKKVYNSYTKEDILDAIKNNDREQQQEISEYFYNTSGIYRSAVEYLAYFFKFDYYLYTKLSYGKKVEKNKELKLFDKGLNMLEKSNIKTRLCQIALEVFKTGCYYGYLIENNDYLVIQDLPQKYCRSRYYFGARPAVEFNMKFFDDEFTDQNYRERIIKSFPKDFQKGYRLYKEGKLPVDFAGDDRGWYLLDPNYAVKFCLGNSDVPYLLSCTPAIIDLNEAKEIDKERSYQQLMKLIIQKLPTDKNGDLLFDVDEARDLHENVRAMLGKIKGANVLTTFADVAVEDMVDTQANARKDELEKVERSLYNEMAIAQGLFNATGNMALNNSILQDAGCVKVLLYQIQDFVNVALEQLISTPKGLSLRLKMLETTNYNYVDMSKLYKEQVQYGYSKLLPQIALGHSQVEILSELRFENDILSISDIMIPAASSNTMSGKVSSSTSTKEEGQVGRKELPDDQKSEKTIQNIESGREGGI